MQPTDEPEEAGHDGESPGDSSSAHDSLPPVASVALHPSPSPVKPPKDGLFDTHPETPQSISSQPPLSRSFSEMAAESLPHRDAPFEPVGPAGSIPSRVVPAAVELPDSARPTYVFLGAVSASTLCADISTKVWAEIVLNRRGFEPIAIIGDNVNITLAYNQGGAWGLFASADEMVRLPFFLAVSVFAIFFIVSLYSRLHPSQRALKWGLPMVLGGALGNLSDRITRSQVIDFIDYRADWVLALNSLINRYASGWTVTDHWPTFNVADIAICIGVVLMGIDMFSHRHRASSVAPSVHPASGSETSSSVLPS